MTDKKRTLTDDEIADAGLDGWTQEGEILSAEFDTGSFATGLALVNRIGDSAEAADHHPDIALTYPSVSVHITSHDVGGLTSRDVDMARTITDHARALGVVVSGG